MARIRSVHPGLFTDEAFAGLSEAAQIFVIGLWTECDDQGVFEWKPLTLRMRLRPTKDGSVEPLLAELESANLIRRYELGGRQLGAVRNFARYQRPKKPNSVHPITDEIRTYVGSTRPSTEPEDAETPIGGEISPQMEGEDGGGGKEEQKKQQPPEPEPRAKRANGIAAYAFEARHIRLTKADFDRWREHFPHLSIAAELEGLDEWAGTHGKNWFNPVAAALAKKERIAAERLAIERGKPLRTSPTQDPRL